MRVYLFWVPTLSVIFAMALDSFDPWDLAIGAVLATVVLALFGPFIFPLGEEQETVPDIPLWRRLIHLPRFLLAVIHNITMGTWQVSLFVLRLRPIEHQGVVALPVGERSEAATVVMAYADNLSPGSVVAVFDDERNILWTHVINASNPEETRERAQELYDKYQRKVLP